jgi:aminopeptidase N
MLWVGLMSCTRPAPPVEPGVSLRLAEERAANLSQLNYSLRFEIPEQVDADIDGRVEVSFELSDNSAPLQLDFREAGDAIRGVSINGRPSAYRFENEHIVIPAAELSVGSNRLGIDFVAGPTSLNRNPDYLYTLFVPDRARTAFPVFDQPDLKASFELTLVVPAGWQALANAAVQSIVDRGAMREYRFRPSDRISSYLFAFLAGKFQSVSLERNGRVMTMLHRETDQDKVQRNLDAIFDLHAASIEWLESYTGIDYPFQKFDFASIPTFQYSGMEHAGAIFYRASDLFLDESPSDTELLDRASLIAHETAHMWFGNLVTMQWFDDVWMKEVFANFMAAKAVNPSFPDIDHALGFLVDHYPSAYSVDRTAGANPIRQVLTNLNEAGQMYGPIIYDKAPIMMRQLEALIGEDPFRDGLREYLQRYSFANAGWPALIDILDSKTSTDLGAWSEVWVNTPGRPQMTAQWETTTAGAGGQYLTQYDAADLERVWPQQFEIAAHAPGRVDRYAVLSTAIATRLADVQSAGAQTVIFNSNGFGYGLFPADLGNLSLWDELNNVEKGAELVNLYENMLAGNGPGPAEYLQALQDIAGRETNQLILRLVLDQLTTIYWNLLPADRRQAVSVQLERLLWRAMLEQTDSSRKKIYFDEFVAIALSPVELQKVYDIWSGTLTIEGLSLSEDDLIEMAQTLAVKLPDRVADIIATQLARTENPDNRRRFEFLLDSMSADASVRDDFFAALADEHNRNVESWVLEALGNLHHPLRIAASEKYLLPSLELLQEIQITGDIFFPQRWLDRTLRNHRSTSAVRTVEAFLDRHPDYNAQLRMKILQSADPMFRANAMIGAESPD